MMRYLFLLLMLSLLSACFGGSEVVPQNHYYHLADISSGLKQVDRPLGVVAISPLRSDALHHERMILYSLQSTPLMLNTYYYHQWSNTPGHLLQEYLIDYLRQVGFAKAIVRYGERERINGQITGYIQRFERIVGAGAPEVMVRLELSFLPRVAGAPRALTRVYTVERRAANNSMEATIVAFSAALQTIYGRFVADVMHQPRTVAAR